MRCVSFLILFLSTATAVTSIGRGGGGPSLSPFDQKVKKTFEKAVRSTTVDECYDLLVRTKIPVARRPSRTVFRNEIASTGRISSLDFTKAVTTLRGRSVVRLWTGLVAALVVSALVRVLPADRMWMNIDLGLIGMIPDVLMDLLPNLDSEFTVQVILSVVLVYNFGSLLLGGLKTILFMGDDETTKKSTPVAAVTVDPPAIFASLPAAPSTNTANATKNAATTHSTTSASTLILGGAGAAAALGLASMANGQPTSRPRPKKKPVATAAAPARPKKKPVKKPVPVLTADPVKAEAPVKKKVAQVKKGRKEGYDGLDLPAGAKARGAVAAGAALMLGSM